MANWQVSGAAKGEADIRHFLGGDMLRVAREACDA
jgi:hypothetical protein